MGFVWATALKDLRRRLRDPVALLLWAGIPFVVLGLLLLAFGGGQVEPQAHLLVADEDESLVSQLLIGALDQGPLEELIRIESVETGEGRARISKGEGSALLLIPDGFSQAVLESRPAELSLLTNPAQTILPAIVEETLSLFVDGVFYLQRLLGEPLAQLAAGPPGGGGGYPNEMVSAISVTMNEVAVRLAEYLTPPLLELETRVEAGTAESLNIGALFFQGMFFLAIFFVAQGLSEDVWQERQQGTFRRLVATPRAVTAALAGKLLAGAMLFGTLAVLVLAAGAWLYEFPLSRLPLAVLWAAFTGWLLLSLLTLVQLYATSRRGGSLLTNLIMFPLVLIGGNFFPLELMPGWLAAVGRWTPNGWALEQQKAILGGEVSVAGLAAAFAGLGAASLLASLLGARRLRRVAAETA